MKTEHSRLKRLRRRVFISYGAMTEIFGLLPQVNVVCFQRVNKWMYNRGVLRIQMSIKLPDKQPLYFPCMKNWKYRVLQFDPQYRQGLSHEHSLFDFNGKSIQVAQRLFWYDETHKTWWAYSKIGNADS